MYYSYSYSYKLLHIVIIFNLIIKYNYFFKISFAYIREKNFKNHLIYKCIKSSNK